MKRKLVLSQDELTSKVIKICSVEGRTEELRVLETKVHAELQTQRRDQRIQAE